MLSDIKIISVLTFSILTLHSQPQANEISKSVSYPNNKEFFIFNADQSKVKYATLAEENSQENEYGELYPDYKAETLEDFLHELSGVAGNEFSRSLEGRRAYRKGRCPSPMYQNHFNLINSKKKKERKVRLVQQYASNRNEKSTLAYPWDNQFNDSQGGSQSNNNNSIKCTKTTTNHYKYDILFPSPKAKAELTFYNHSESLISPTSECNLDPKWPSFDTASMEPIAEPNFPSNYYSTNKGRKAPVPKILQFKKFLFAHEMHPNQTKPSYQSEKSTKTVNSGDRLPEESFIFYTTTAKVYRTKGSHVLNPFHQNQLQQLSFDNQSGIIYNTSSLNFQEGINQSIPSMINSPENSNAEQIIEGKIIDYQNNVDWLTTNAALDNILEPKFVLTSTPSGLVSADYSLRNAVQDIGSNDLRYFNENKGKTRPNNQQEALFVSEKDYKEFEKNQRNPNPPQNLKENCDNAFTKHQNNDVQNRISNIFNVKRGIFMKLAKEFIQERSNFTNAVNLSSSNYHNQEKEPVSLKNTLNQKLSGVNLRKRVACEKNSDLVNNGVLSNLYDDYDYYFILGDNNTNESLFQNGHRAANVRTSEKSIKNSYLKKNTPSYKLKKTKNLRLNKTNLSYSDKQTKFTANQTVGKISTLSPSIIQRLWSNVANREKLSLRGGKNYILNLFRKKDNYSTVKGWISSTPAQPIVKNFLFRKRSNTHGDELRIIDHKGILEDFAARDGNYRKIFIPNNSSNKMASYSIWSHNTLLPSKSKDESLKHLHKRNIVPHVEQSGKETILQNSIFESNDWNPLTNPNGLFEIHRELERAKRKSGAAKRGFPLRLFPRNKHFRRSIFNNEMEDYNTKFQNLQKDLLELQKAISSPKAGRPTRNEEKNLTLQIRVIVDVVNNSLGPTENQEDEQLKKRDTKLVEKKIDTVPMPLEHDSPLVEEKKVFQVWRNKRVDGAVNESHKNSLIKRENSSNSDLSDDIIRNITYLLDNLLENYKLHNGDGKKSRLNHGVTTNPEYYEDQKLKRSFVYHNESPSFNLETYKPIITGYYNISSQLGGSKNQNLIKDVTEASYKNLLTEINKILSKEKFNSFIVRKRRGTNEKQLQKKMMDYNKKLFQNEVNSLYNIVDSINNQLVFKKIIDSLRNGDKISNKDENFQNVGETSIIPLQDGILTENEKQLHSVRRNDAKVEEILETVDNIGREINQIDFKGKLLGRLLHPEINSRKKEYNHRNKVKVNRKNNWSTSSIKTKSPSHAKSFRNNHEKINKNINKSMNVTEVKKKKQTLPPCCETNETTSVDQGNHLTIDWCCPNEPTRFLSTTESSVESTTESSTGSVLTSTKKANQTEEEITSPSVQNPKQATENTSSIQESKQPEKSTSSTNGTKNPSESISTTQTIGSSTQTIGSSTKTIGSGNQTIEPASQTVGSTTQTIGSATQTNGSAIQTIESTTQTIGSATQTIGSTIKTSESTIKTSESTIQTIGSTIKTSESTIQSMPKENDLPYHNKKTKHKP